MNVKIFIIFIIILFVVFGVGFSVGSLTSHYTKQTLRVRSDVTFGKAPLNVSFYSEILNSNEKIEQYCWNFNDGMTSDQPNITHTFFREGVFHVTLTIWDAKGNELSESIEITVMEYYKPIASATADETYGKAPLTVQFSAACYDVDGNEFEYVWDFDDGKTSAMENPQHTFGEIGTYIVRLTVYDTDDQEDTDAIQINVVGNYPPIASASANKEQGNAPLTVEFTGMGYDVDGENPLYHWNFEDGILKKNEESSEQNSTHTFYFPGTYLVKLTVEDDEGATDTDVVRIVVKESFFSKTVDFLFDISMRSFIKGSISEFFGSLLGKLLGNLLWKTI